MPGLCDVVIPAKNSPWWLEWCLEDLFRNSTPQERASVKVVDDRSAPDYSLTIQRICARFPEVELLRNVGEPGFGGAVNFGVAHSPKAEYVLLLNTDCLITKNTIKKLVAVCELDRSVGMSCPLSNNSPVLSLPLRSGYSYVEMNELLERTCATRPRRDVVFEACTVVGNCLMVRRECWEAVGGLESEWGAGYGEETDLQFRAMDHGYHGAATIDTYVYHFGSGAFRYESGHEALQKQNLRLFHSKWGERYRELSARCSGRDPVAVAEYLVEEEASATLRPDVLFLLPGISQSVGGVHVVVELCNYLVRHGLEAKFAILGAIPEGQLESFSEPVLTGLLHYATEAELLADENIRPRAVVATLFNTSLPAYHLARSLDIPLVNFVQGYEVYFSNGTWRKEVEISYALANETIVTSSWLQDCVRSVCPSASITRLPIGVSDALFNADRAAREGRIRSKIRVAAVLRSPESDKGQWILLDVLARLRRHADLLSLMLFTCGDYDVPVFWRQQVETVIVTLPLDKGNVARHLKACDVLVDASLHEGFGLLPLEAMACGATVVASDSGGIRQFLENGRNGIIVSEFNKPELFESEIASLARDRKRLERLQAEAANTGIEYSSQSCFPAYLEHLQALASSDRRAEHCGEVLARATARSDFRALGSGQQVEDLETAVVLHATGNDQNLYLRGVELPRGAVGVLRIVIDSPDETKLQLFWPTPTLTETSETVPVYCESKAMTRRLLAGRNDVTMLLHDDMLQGPLRLDASDIPGDFYLHECCVRAMKPTAMGADENLHDLYAGAGSTSEVFAVRPSSVDCVDSIVEVNNDLHLSACARFRIASHQAYFEVPDFEQLEGTFVCLWLDMVSPCATQFRLCFREQRSASWDDQSRAVNLSQGRNRFYVALEPCDRRRARFRIYPGTAPGTYEIRAFEIRGFPIESATAAPSSTMVAVPLKKPSGDTREKGRNRRRNRTCNSTNGSTEPCQVDRGSDGRRPQASNQ